MDFRNARMWVVYNITTTKDESCRSYPNKTNSIQQWNANRVLESWWHWFQNRHPNISIEVAERLEVSRGQGLITTSYTTSYNNLQTLFS
jgi:hypothetical protein